MKTFIRVTIEHPDDAPINWFMSYTLEQYFNEISADMDKGWSIRLSASDE